MKEATLQGFYIIYETMASILNHLDYILSIGTVELYVPQYLPLDFNSTMGNGIPQPDGTILLYAEIWYLEPDTFRKEYEEAGLSVENLTYQFFLEHLKTLAIAEVYTEFIHDKTEQAVPLTIKKIEMVFSDGTTLNCTDNLSVSVYQQLALVA